MCLETSLAWPHLPVNVFKFVMGVILLKINCKWMLKKRWSCYLLFWVKTVEVLTWLDGWKKNSSKLLVHQRHSLTNQVISPCWSQYSCLIWLSCRRDARDTKWPRARLKAMKLCEKISRFRSGILFEFERQFLCPLHVVSRLSSADPADGYSSIKIAMIKQNLWWTMFPARFLFPLPKPPHGHKEDFAEERDPSRSPLHFHSRARHVLQARKLELLLKVTKDNPFQVCLSCHTTWRMIARVGFDCNWLQ